MTKLLRNLYKNYFLPYFPLVVVFTASLYVASDSDLGWHLRYGEYFIKNHAVLKQNIFSSEMPNYVWPNHSWGTDVITYLVFHAFSFYGLSILGALVVAATFYFFSKAARLTFWEQSIIFPLLLFLESPLTSVSFRSQLLTLTFLGALYYLLSLYEKGNKRKALLLPFLFLLWANFHGEFVFGLAIFAAYLFFHLIIRLQQNGWKLKKPVINDGLFLGAILFVSFLCTLINPWGFGVFAEAFRHVGNPYQRFIIEWTPFNKFSDLWWINIFFAFFLIASIAKIISMGKFAKYFPYIMIALGLFLLSFSVRRYAWPMYLLSVPMISVFVADFKPKWEDIAETLGSVILISVYLFVILVKAPAENLGTMNWNRFCSEFSLCSPQSAQFLETHHYPGKLYSFYNWGGWLIWNYPQIKPTIDGRMPFWRDKNGYSAFAKYYPYEQNWVDIDKSDYDIVYMSPIKPLFKRMLQLVQMGRWVEVYQDKYAGIFVRKSANPSS